VSGRQVPEKLNRLQSQRMAYIPALLLCVVFGCGDAESRSSGVTLRSVSLTTVRAVTLEDRIEAAGELLAKESAVIAAEVGGRITLVVLEEGSAVEEGQAVLKIDPERRKLVLASAQAALEEMRAALHKAERRQQRITKLRADNVASQETLDEVETELQLAASRLVGAEARFGTAQRTLRDATVSAPFAGLVARRYVSRGEYVEVGAKLFDLVSLDPIEVAFRVAERDSGRVALGQRVEVRVTPFPDEVFEAEVSIVSPTIDPRTRTLRVKAKLDNSDGRLRPGLFAKVDLGVATRENVLVVPEEAVLLRVNGPVVFLLNADRRVERRDVELGVNRNGSVEVVTGLAPGDRIVERGQSRLVDGELVAPRSIEGERLEEFDTLGSQQAADG
jgi:membrane fusion protein (multidrug efflux system)